jgi:hypothetical protein
MARFYANENIARQVARQVVEELRRLGHDVLTTAEAGKANASVQDEEVLRFASAAERFLLTHNRLHFRRLHAHPSGDHAGIVLCSVDSDFPRLARAIHDCITNTDQIRNCLLRVNRPS